VLKTLKRNARWILLFPAFITLVVFLANSSNGRELASSNYFPILIGWMVPCVIAICAISVLRKRHLKIEERQ
jgi:lipopolysaccharide export LptBFGC system permease protein LptF